jgi:hypothetical protein
VQAEVSILTTAFLFIDWECGGLVGKNARVTLGFNAAVLGSIPESLTVSCGRGRNNCWVA